MDFGEFILISLFSCGSERARGAMTASDRQLSSFFGSYRFRRAALQSNSVWCICLMYYAYFSSSNSIIMSVCAYIKYKYHNIQSLSLSRARSAQSTRQTANRTEGEVNEEENNNKQIGIYEFYWPFDVLWRICNLQNRRKNVGICSWHRQSSLS